MAKYNVSRVEKGDARETPVAPSLEAAQEQQSQSVDDMIKDYYELLTAARQAQADVQVDRIVNKKTDAEAKLIDECNELNRLAENKLSDLKASLKRAKFDGGSMDYIAKRAGELGVDLDKLIELSKKSYVLRSNK